MKIIEYINTFLEDFKTMYPNYNSIRTSVGFSPDLLEMRNFNDLPLILVEEINYSNNISTIVQNIGKLSFSLLYLDQNTYENGYKKIEDSFVNDFHSYLHNNCNDVSIVNIKYDTDEDNRYGITYQIEVSIEL